MHLFPSNIYWMPVKAEHYAKGTRTIKNIAVISGLLQ